MANDYVKTITTHDGTIYDINDARLTVTAEDAGKVVSVDNNGNLILTTPSSGGGTQLYKHIITSTVRGYDGIVEGATYYNLDITIEIISLSSTPISSQTLFTSVVLNSVIRGIFYVQQGPAADIVGRVILPENATDVGYFYLMLPSVSDYQGLSDSGFVVGGDFSGYFTVTSWGTFNDVVTPL